MTEFCARVSLVTLLCGNKGISMEKMLKILIDVSAGMLHLSQENMCIGTNELNFLFTVVTLLHAIYFLVKIGLLKCQVRVVLFLYCVNFRLSRLAEDNEEEIFTTSEIG